MMTRFMTILLGAALLGTPALAQDMTPGADALPARITDFALTEADDDHTIGSEDAALTLIVWASVTCPHCRDWFSDEWPTIKSELVETGKLRFVFREFPTAPAQLAMTGFLMAECAPSEDYMSLIEYQMQNQDAIFKAAKEGRGREAYNKIAKMAGMDDDEAITACLRNPDMLAHIQDNSQRADVAGVRGVPALYINGEAYAGPSDAKSMIALLTKMDDAGMTALPPEIKALQSKAKAHDHSDHAGHAHD